MDMNAAFENAFASHLRGDLAAAESQYHDLLRADPDQARIWHLAGVLSHQNGNPHRACLLIGEAIKRSPDHADYLVSLGAALKADGQLLAARSALERAVTLIPEDAEILNELGNTATALADYPSAVNCYTRAVSLAPDKAVYHFNLGLAHRNHGHSDRAQNSFREAIRIEPELAEAHFALGNLLQDLGEFEKALECYRRLLTLSPDFGEAYYNMGNAAKAVGRQDLAVDSFQKAIDLQPDHAGAYNNLGLVLKDKRLFREAILHFEKAQALDPHLAEAKYNLGVSEQLRGRYEIGLNWFQAAMQAQPDYAPARWMWHLSLPILYRTADEIIGHRKRFRNQLSELIENTPLETAHERRLAVQGIGSMTNFFLQYQCRNDVALQTSYGQFASKVMGSAYPEWSLERSMAARPARGNPRIGYVSSFMRAHTVGEFLAGWLKHHDREQFDIHCYHLGTQTDAMTPRFVERAKVFHQIGDDLEKAARCILADDLQVLVYTDIGMNALATQLAALRLAPVQCKGWGHPVTTGLPTIDYYLSSDLMEPEDAQQHYSETLVRLPNLALAYTPPDLPRLPKTRRDFGLPENAFICLNSQSLFKLLPQHDDIYPRIALAAPGVRFVFLAHGVQEITEQFMQRLAAAFETFGLTAEDYCHMLPRQNFPDFLSLNLASDLLLDSFDWSGGKTTLEAISCGLPVVTRPGKLMRGRHSSAILTMMGAEETIAENKTAYVRLVARLSTDREYYERIAGNICTRRQKLYDDAECIKVLEDFYRRVCDPGQRTQTAITPH
jgi:predicted O-linked N-acetylglucosamine transferase (SPINDLY family)